MDFADLQNRFAYHPATTEEVREMHQAIRHDCLKLSEAINNLCPEGREKSLAITNLEQTMMWANAAIARQGPQE